MMVGLSVTTLWTVSHRVPRPPDPGGGQECANESEWQPKALSVELFLASYACVRSTFGKKANDAEDNHVMELLSRNTKFCNRRRSISRAMRSGIGPWTSI